jgi:hypothetical protein
VATDAGHAIPRAYLLVAGRGACRLAIGIGVRPCPLVKPRKECRGGRRPRLDQAVWTIRALGLAAPYSRGPLLQKGSLAAELMGPRVDLASTRAHRGAPSDRPMFLTDNNAAA